MKSFRLGRDRMKSFRGIAAILALMAAILALVASGEENEATRADDSEETPEADGEGAETFGVGDPVALGDWEVQVYEFTDPVEVSPDSVFPPDEGNKRVKFDAEVTNQGDSPATVSSLLCFELKDGDNRTYDQTIDESNVGSIDGEIAPGAALRGEVVYDVPEASEGFVLNFKCDLLSSGSAEIQLS